MYLIRYILPKPDEVVTIRRLRTGVAATDRPAHVRAGVRVTMLHGIFKRDGREVPELRASITGLWPEFYARSIPNSLHLMAVHSTWETVLDTSSYDARL
jgi:hypothetical protein